MATVTVDGLDCWTNYTVTAGGTFKGDLVGLRSPHGNITTNPCPVCLAEGNTVRDYKLVCYQVPYLLLQQLHT